MYANAKQRIDMCNLAIESIPWIIKIDKPYGSALECMKHYKTKNNEHEAIMGII